MNDKSHNNGNLISRVIVFLKMISIIFIILFSILIVYISRQDFFIASGSEVLTTIFRPPWWSQLLAIFLFSTSLFITFFPFIRWLNWKSIRLLLITSTFMLYMMSIHSISICSRESQIKDVWGIFSIQAIPFDPVDGPNIDIRYQQHLFWIRFSNKTGKKIWIFLGIPPWQLNRHEILNDPMLIGIKMDNQ